MSIYHSFEDEQEATSGACRIVKEYECFYCHKTVIYPRITWMGSTSTIDFHPDCVPLLSIRLFRDVWESQTIHKHIVSKK